MKPNNVTLKQIRAFILVADKGSFVAAAETLALSQPALSQSIRQLEEQIGSPLFHRTTRRVKLTSLGTEFLATARNLASAFDVAIGDIQDGAAHRRGRVIVACLPSIAYRIMPQVIAINEGLNSSVRVIVRDVNLTSIIAAVTEGHADLGIGSVVVPTPSLDGIVVARDRFYSVMPRDHVLARRKEVRWRDLAGHAFIAMTVETGIRGLVDNAVAPHGVRLRVCSEVSNLATVYGLLEARVGITALPGLALPADNHPFLVHRPLKSPTLERTIRLVWRHGVGLSPAAHALVEAIRQSVIEGRVINDGKRVHWAEAWVTPTKAKRR